MNRKQLMELCASLPDAQVDAPFAGDENIVARHKSNRKWFALICELDGKLCINLKCEPMEAEFLRHVYPGVRPAWHMNKIHWNTVEARAVPEKILLDMIWRSHALTGPKKSRAGIAGKE